MLFQLLGSIQAILVVRYHRARSHTGHTGQEGCLGKTAVFGERAFPWAPPQRCLSFISDLLRVPLAAQMQTKSQHSKFKKTHVSLHKAPKFECTDICWFTSRPEMSGAHFFQPWETLQRSANSLCIGRACSEYALDISPEALSLGVPARWCFWKHGSTLH